MTVYSSDGHEASNAIAPKESLPEPQKEDLPIPTIPESHPVTKDDVPTQIPVREWMDRGLTSNDVDAVANAVYASVTTTTAERRAFVESIISGGRYVEEVSLLGGAVKVKFRSRSQRESEAVVSYTNVQAANGKYETMEERAADTRLALLVFQVAELNGVSYPVPDGELKFTETADGLTPPKWSESMELWKSKPEGLVTMINKAMIEFEAKYQQMVREADDVNFWNPGGSTGN